jgi:hypothetical protein
MDSTTRITARDHAALAVVFTCSLAPSRGSSRHDSLSRDVLRVWGLIRNLRRYVVITIGVSSPKDGSLTSPNRASWSGEPQPAGSSPLPPPNIRSRVLSAPGREPVDSHSPAGLGGVRQPLSSRTWFSLGW